MLLPFFLKQKKMKNFFNDLPQWAKALIVITIIVIVILVVRHFYKKWDNNRKQKLLEGQQTTTSINGQTVSIDLGTKASAIYNAFWSNDWFGWTEDEEQAMIEISNVPKSLIPKLSEIYNKLYSKNLKSDLQKYLSASDWNKISYLFS